MLVFVINKDGKPLMPCKPQRARNLLKHGKAAISRYKPFTIQLLYGSSGYVQPIDIGVDTGAKHIGVAAVSGSRVIITCEIELRDDIKSNLETKKIYRRGRRSRKCRYRRPRFLNRGKSDGWLPPSIRSRIDNTFFWMDKLSSLLPMPCLHIEVGKFDAAKMIDPDIGGVVYQQGDSYGFYATRYFVFARDNYTCQVCGKKDRVLRTHHIIFKPEGTDRPDNLITVCVDCHNHKNHQPGGILYKWKEERKKVKRYKEPPFMNSLRVKVYRRYPKADITYGNVTTVRRRALGLGKSHINDAVAASGAVSAAFVTPDTLYIKQFRKKKRSLHEATARKGRTVKDVTSKRSKKNTPAQDGFYLNDKVSLFGKEGYISGFTRGGVFVKSISGGYITLEGKAYKQVPAKSLKLVCHNNNWQVEIRSP